jgi:uncharacterized SAM-binding protein YcdF (DUF218 family)
MSEAAHAPKLSSPKARWPWYLAIAVAAIGLIYFACLCSRIIDAGSRQQLHTADAIVVFGAAEYVGHPSPVYRARLDHAFDLYQQKLAGVIITTGGAADDPSYSEGGVGRDYLMHRGVPESSLIAETLGSDTAKSAQRVGVILRTNHMKTCLVVSDAYHVFRVSRMLEHEGVQVYVAPRPDSRLHSPWQRMRTVSREAISYLLWRLGLHRD